jgi:hypothetical protein
VLVQHRGLDDDDRSAVEALAGDGVVVAPAAALPDGATVVATAWVTKQVCQELDVEVLRAFAADQADAAPDDHG